MDLIKAVCPQCSTQYQLKPDQLSIANGQVRCGICKAVFQADPEKAAAAKPQAAQQPPKKPPQQPPQPTQPAARSQKPQREGQSSFVNNEDELLLNDTGVRKSFNKRSDFETGEFDATLDDFDNISDSINDSFGDHDSSGEMSFSDEFQNAEKAFSEDLQPKHGSSAAKGSDETADSDESWARDLIEEVEDDHGGIKASGKPKESPFSSPQASSGGKKPDESRKALGSNKDDFDFESELEGLDLGAPLSLSKSEEQDLGFGTSDKDELINRIPPEPMILHLFSSDSPAVKILYGAAAVLAGCLLVFQIFYFQFDTLSRDPEWRSFYEGACSKLGCTLPEQYSIKDISAQLLTVKSHPYYRDSLIVDTIITNHANIQQPFPLIELFFSDNSQKVVAARRFQPREYLRGELATTDMMPGKQSVHIALDLNDPGQNATGYWITLRYPD